MSEQETGGLVYQDRDLRVYSNGQVAPGYIEVHDITLCIPLTDTGMVIFILESSAAYDVNVMVLPGGKLNGDLTHAQAADRELQEQIGFKAARLQYLGELRRWTKHIRGTVYVYLARELTPSLLPPNQSSEIQTQLASLDTFERLMQNRQLFDSTVIAALFMARQFIQKEKTP